MNEVTLSKSQIKALAEALDEDFPSSGGGTKFKISATNLHGGDTFSMERIANQGRSSGQQIEEKNSQLGAESDRIIFVTKAGQTQRLQG